MPGQYKSKLNQLLTTKFKNKFKIKPTETTILSIIDQEINGLLKDGRATELMLVSLDSRLNKAVKEARGNGVKPGDLQRASENAAAMRLPPVLRERKRVSMAESPEPVVTKTGRMKIYSVDRAAALVMSDQQWKTRVDKDFDEFTAEQERLKKDRYDKKRAIQRE